MMIDASARFPHTPTPKTCFYALSLAKSLPTYDSSLAAISSVVLLCTKAKHGITQTAQAVALSNRLWRSPYHIDDLADTQHFCTNPSDVRARGRPSTLQ